MPDAWAAAGGVALLERAVGYTLGSLRLVNPSDLHRSTPCRAWNLRQLLGHLDDSLVELIAAVEAPVRRARLGDDVVSALRDRARELVGAWAATLHPPTMSIDGTVLSGGIVSGAGAIEVAVHGWDVARACGVRWPIPSSLADEMLDLAVLLVTDAERPALFAPAVPISPRADLSDRLVAYLGRDPF